MATARGAALSDAQLVELSRRGDQNAFGQLVKRYERLVLSVAYHTGADEQMAQDIAQDVFLRAWQALPAFQMHQDNSFRSWISRIASNRTVDLLRRERATVDVDLLSQASGEQPDDLIGRQELAAQVRRALLRLPDHSRQALVLREYGQLSYREISETLGIPIGTVMSRLNYARNWLKRELGEAIER